VLPLRQKYILDQVKYFVREEIKAEREELSWADDDVVLLFPSFFFPFSLLPFTGLSVFLSSTPLPPVHTAAGGTGVDAGYPAVS
jgi:hypothetical protein